MLMLMGLGSVVGMHMVMRTMLPSVGVLMPFPGGMVMGMLVFVLVSMGMDMLMFVAVPADAGMLVFMLMFMGMLVLMFVPMLMIAFHNTASLRRCMPAHHGAGGGHGPCTGT